MADLKNIMNVEDDHPDSRQIKDARQSASASFQDPASSRFSSSSSSRHATQANLSPTSSYTLDQRRSSSSHALHSFAANTPSSLSPAPGSSSASTSRRRSNTSTDSMDSPYASGHGLQGMSPPGPHMRSFPPSGGDGPVKYTPVTGRVSRAKKGVPVHICDLCSPPKTFTRAEHLRRHQLSHGSAGLACTVPGCDRSFYRRDLLERHQQRHEQEREVGKSGDSYQRAPGPYDSSSPGSPPYPAGMPSVYDSSPNPGSSSGRGGSSMPMETGAWPSVNTHSGRGDGSGHHIRHASDDFAMGDAVNWGAGISPAYQQPRTLPELLTPVSHIPLHDRASSDSSNRSTPSTHSQHMPSHTSSAEWGSIPTYPSMSTGAYALGITYPASPPQMYPQVYTEGLGMPLAYDDAAIYGSHQPPNTAVRSLSPHMAVVQSSETLVTTPSALPADRLILPQACGRQPDEALGLLAAADGVPVCLSRAAFGAVPAYLDVFWDRVHPVYPVIHKHTFEDASEVAPDHVDLLRCAMAAVATQYLADREHRINGHQLHAYACQGLKMLASAEDWTLPIMQAILLCEYYARFRGRKREDHQPTAVFGMLYQLAMGFQAAFTPVPGGRNASMAWRAWVHTEARRRLLAACFLLDVHSMLYLEQPGVSFGTLDYSSPTTLPIPLTADTTDLWEAATAQAWSSLLRPNMIPQTLSNTLTTALTRADIAAAPPFDASLLLVAHALQLPPRQVLTDTELFHDASVVNTRKMHMAVLFSDSAAANTYLALHYTPLHALMSVSGESWVFSKKVPLAHCFTGHKKQLENWRASGNAAAATVFAARAIRAFLALGSHPDAAVQGWPCREISGYWGLYVCTLICWAFGSDASKAPVNTGRERAVRWIRETAAMEPGTLQDGAEGRWGARSVVGLVREELARECVGGQSRMFADAVRVLKKLEGESWKGF